MKPITWLAPNPPYTHGETVPTWFAPSAYPAAYAPPVRKATSPINTRAVATRRPPYRMSNYSRRAI